MEKIMTTFAKMMAPTPMPGGASEWHFFRSYVGTALWSSNDESDESGGEPLDSNYDIDDIDESCLETLAKDCAQFYESHCADIHCDGAPMANDMDGSIAAREAAMAGHDFWLTQNGHGAGFWDGDWPEAVGERLTEASQGFRARDLYVGDDGKIHV